MDKCIVLHLTMNLRVTHQILVIFGIMSKVMGFLKSLMVFEIALGLLKSSEIIYCWAAIFVADFILGKFKEWCVRL